MADEPRFKGIAAMGHYAEAGLRVGEESLALAKSDSGTLRAILGELQAIRSLLEDSRRRP